MKTAQDSQRRAEDAYRSGAGNRAPWQVLRSSLTVKIFVICFVSIHLPLAALIAHLLIGGAVNTGTVVILVLAATLVGTAGCLLSLWWLIRPLRQLATSLMRYRSEGAPVTVDIRAEDEIGVVARAVSSLITDLDASLKHLHHQANTDPLTGLSNRRMVLSRGAEEVGKAIRKGDTVSLVLFDLDYFKAINDKFGHETGDKVLAEAAQTIRENLRPDDVAGRVGGEEFCVLLPGTGLAQAEAIAERLRTSLETLVLDPLPAGRVTASFGIAQTGGKIVSFQRLMASADVALYLAKENGRNCIRLATPRDDQSLRLQ